MCYTWHYSWPDTLETILHWFFQNLTSNRASFFCIWLSGSIHFIESIQTLKISAVLKKKNLEKPGEESNLFWTPPTVKPNFFQNSSSKWVLFLCCNQFIKTLLLSYQKRLSENISDFSLQGGTLLILFTWHKLYCYITVTNPIPTLTYFLFLFTWPNSYINCLVCITVPDQDPTSTTFSAVTNTVLALRALAVGGLSLHLRRERAMWTAVQNQNWSCQPDIIDCTHKNQLCEYKFLTKWVVASAICRAARVKKTNMWMDFTMVLSLEPCVYVVE